jgi:hypothetical protein
MRTCRVRSHAQKWGRLRERRGVLAAGGGAVLGDYPSSTRISEFALPRLFVVVILAHSLYKGISMERAILQQGVNFSSCPEEAAASSTLTRQCRISI